MEPEKPNKDKVLPQPLQALILSLIMGLFLLGSFMVIYRLHATLASAGLAASTFIAFAFPNAESGRPRYILGGYACGLAGGGLGSLLLHALTKGAVQEQLELCIYCCIVAMVITAFLMMLLRLQHPPAAAFALSLVMEAHNPMWVGLSVIGVVLVLCVVRWLISTWLGTYFGMPKPAPRRGKK